MVKISVNHQWEKQYRKWLLAVGVVGGLIIWHLSNFSNALLFVTGVIVFWYTRETFELKQISNEQLEETREQTDLQIMPYLRLQWNNDRDKYVYDIVNEGEGLAIDVEFASMKFLDQKIESDYKIKSRPLIAKSKPTTVTTDELNDTNNIVQGVGIKGYLERKIALGHYIEAKYKDVKDRKYKVVFQSDASYNDRFKIVEQKRISD
jgi:hypothetical protein